ncbi:MAG TPA: DUF885 domain-containing protein [Steroidobacteraceae bacterium]|nr:DUF885 domain-containing protein [Steroidobacteraceae bacterium]
MSPARPLRWLAFVALAAVATGCSRDAPSPGAGEMASAPVTGPDLSTLVEQYYEEYLELNPLQATVNGDHRYDDRLEDSLSERWLADSLALEQRYLAAARQIDAATLSPAERLTLEIFVYGREASIEAARYPSELLPVNQMGSLPAFFVQMGSGTSVQPFATVQDYENFLKRIAQFKGWVDTAIANMRIGIEKGVVPPRIVVEKTIPQIAAQVVEDPESSLFYRPVATFPDEIPDGDRSRLEAAYRNAIETDLVPAYAKLRRFLEDEYLPAARETVGLDALPAGQAWYASLVRRYTTTDLDPVAIHEIGLAEVARIRGEMDAIRQQVGFDGDLAAFMTHLKSAPEFRFDTPQALLDAYGAMRERVDAEVPRLFGRQPRTQFEIRPVEAFREQSAPPASYLPGAPDGSRPAVFYVNTYDVTSRPSYMIEGIYLHEAVPGHHFQIALQKEMQELPSFRRFSSVTAYVEGWGLYAESLGTELGQYTDPYARFGALTAEIWRAVRLVVDTGLHAKVWTRQQAIDYMTANSAIGATDVIAEVDRYIAIPGQALAYKVGQLKLSELRRLAEERLGTAFDIREFHEMILEDGSMPLSVLEAKALRWMETRAAMQPATSAAT